jgi:H+/Cl- antiporter ClcA
MTAESLSSRMRSLKQLLAGLGIAALAGLGSGLASAVFLVALDAVTATRWRQPWLLFLLPVAGLLMVRAYATWGRGSERGVSLLLDVVHRRAPQVPWTMAPLVFGATLLSHLCGGSVGREGTAVQMGAALSHVWGRRFSSLVPDPSVAVLAGIAGGFGAVFGTPWAGALYAIELPVLGRFQWHRALQCLVASWLGHATCMSLGVQHTTYPLARALSLQPAGGLWQCALAALVFGLAARLFVGCLRGWSLLFERLVIPRWALPVVSALVILALTQVLGTDAYLGIGITGRLPGDPSIVRCFEPGGVTAWSWGWKLLFTTVTLAGGFKGGEVTPLFFVGAALGNTLAMLAGWPVQEFAAMGFVAVFAAASHTPLACAVLGWELFGPELLLPALLTCLVANAVATGTGLYDARTQSDPGSQ